MGGFPYASLEKITWYHRHCMNREVIWSIVWDGKTFYNASETCFVRCFAIRAATTHSELWVTNWMKVAVQGRKHKGPFQILRYGTQKRHVNPIHCYTYHWRLSTTIIVANLPHMNFTNESGKMSYQGKAGWCILVVVILLQRRHLVWDSFEIGLLFRCHRSLSSYCTGPSFPTERLNENSKFTVVSHWLQFCVGN